MSKTNRARIGIRVDYRWKIGDVIFLHAVESWGSQAVSATQSVILFYCSVALFCSHSIRKVFER